MFRLFFALCAAALFADPVQAPYGSWTSPITAEQVAAGGIRFDDIAFEGGTLYWVEMRPEEEGRGALVRWTKENGEEELLPKEYSVRNRVHEYGGGALLVADDRVYFISDSDQQIYQRCSCGLVRQITEREGARFADGSAHPFDCWLYYVMEEHGKEVVNSIARVDSFNGEVETLVAGRDFYSNPRISPDGKQLAYICWDHPNMPWDGSELHVLDLETKEDRIVAGGKSESVTDPEWDSEGRLFYVSDKNGYWNLYAEHQNLPIWDTAAEFAFPQWWFGGSWVGLLEKKAFCTFAKNGVNHFAAVYLEGDVEEHTLPYTWVKNMRVKNGQAAMIASSHKEPDSIVLYDLGSKKTTIVKRCLAQEFDVCLASEPKAIEFPTANGLTAHAFYYPPCNPRYRAVDGEKPPLLVVTHGGPTAHDAPEFDLTRLYWTTRGFAVVDVNYGGSTGYGRPYRERLNGQWGIVDVDDCCNAALYCAEQGLADPSRMTIEGGSAGGFTTLACLAFRNVFQAGADYYGVSDLERLTLDMHKFESRYLDRLVGAYPEKREIYLERSPIRSIDTIQSPIIIFQGDEDVIIPPSQSSEMYNNLLKRGVPAEYHLYKGEQHGFRKAETIRHALEAQLAFFSKVLGFPMKN